jgi:hypothetical protein
MGVLKSQIPNPKSKIFNGGGDREEMREMGRWGDGGSKISNPKSQIPNPKSQIPNPKSQIPNPKSQIFNGGGDRKEIRERGRWGDRVSQIPNPKSKIQNPKSSIVVAIARRSGRWGDGGIEFFSLPSSSLGAHPPRASSLATYRS